MTAPRPQGCPAPGPQAPGPPAAPEGGPPAGGPRPDPLPPDALRVAELTCARLCHDLGGPLGTLGHALELAAEDAAAGAPTLALASEAASAMVAQLRLLRAAWAGDGAALDRAALVALAAGPLAARRVTLDLSGVPAGVTLAPAAARAVLNLLLLGADALPGGGLVKLAGAVGAGVVGAGAVGGPGGPALGSGMVLCIAGARAAWPAALERTLHDPDAAWRALDDPRLMQAPLAALAARAAGLRLWLAEGADPLPLRLAPDRAFTFSS